MAAPDYVTAARAELPAGADPKAVARHLERCRESQEAVARQLGYTGPPGRGKAAMLVVLRCGYCEMEFRSARPDAVTCSSACKQARHVALRYPDDCDVPGPWLRHDTFSEERYTATGFGGMTAQEGYKADLRCRAERARRRAAVAS